MKKAKYFVSAEQKKTDREIKTFKRLPEETIMPDDGIVYPMYVYICDGVFRRQWEWMDPMTVAVWKARENIKEVRRCNLFGHEGARLGDKVEE